MQVQLVLFLLASLVAVCSVNGQSNCCSKFTASQERFLRMLLQEEAKGLKAGMMHAFSMPAAVKWFNLSANPICFGAKDNSFGRFIIKSEGFLAAIKLVHSSGTITCDHSTLAKSPAEFDSKWGCSPKHPYLGKTSINTLITNGNDKIIFPKNHHFTHDHGNFWYNMEQFDSMSDMLVFQRFDEPLYVWPGQELRLWYGEDLKDVSESDNDGRTCAQVFGLYV